MGRTKGFKIVFKKRKKKNFVSLCGGVASWFQGFLVLADAGVEVFYFSNCFVDLSCSSLCFLSCASFCSCFHVFYFSVLEFRWLFGFARLKRDCGN